MYIFDWWSDHQKNSPDQIAWKSYGTLKFAQRTQLANPQHFGLDSKNQIQVMLPGYFIVLEVSKDVHGN